MTKPGFVPYRPERLAAQQMLERGRAFYESMNERRSVREFSSDPVSRNLIEAAIRAAGTAPSGAHRQPWHFVAVSNSELKRQIREAAEQEEYQSYTQRMPDEWRAALAPLGTDWHKPFLQTVPWLVVVFEELHGIAADGTRIKNYYIKESVGIACGLFIAAIHQMGLATLTHTPSPMGFLGEILNRPANERAYMLFPVGYPAADAVVPDIHRKTLNQIATWRE